MSNETATSKATNSPQTPSPMGRSDATSFKLPELSSPAAAHSPHAVSVDATPQDRAPDFANFVKGVFIVTGILAVRFATVYSKQLGSMFTIGFGLELVFGGPIHHYFNADNLASPVVDPEKLPDPPNAPSRVNYLPLEVLSDPVLHEPFPEFDTIWDSVKVARMNSTGSSKEHQTLLKHFVVYELDTAAIALENDREFQQDFRRMCISYDMFAPDHAHLGVFAVSRLFEEPQFHQASREVVLEDQEDDTLVEVQEVIHIHEDIEVREELQVIERDSASDLTEVNSEDVDVEKEIEDCVKEPQQELLPTESSDEWGTDVEKEIEGYVEEVQDKLTPTVISVESSTFKQIPKMTITITISVSYEPWLEELIKRHGCPVFIDDDIEEHLCRCYRRQQCGNVKFLADDGGSSCISKAVNSSGRPSWPGRSITHDALDIGYMLEKLKTIGSPQVLQTIFNKDAEDIICTRALFSKVNFAREQLVQEWHKPWATRISASNGYKTSKNWSEFVLRLRKHAPGSGSQFRPYLTIQGEEFLNEECTDYTLSREEDETSADSMVNRLRISPLHEKLVDHHRIANWVCDLDDIDLVDPNAFDSCYCNICAALEVHFYRAEGDYNVEEVGKHNELYGISYTGEGDLVNDQGDHRCHKELKDSWPTEAWQVLNYDWDMDLPDVDVAAFDDWDNDYEDDDDGTSDDDLGDGLDDDLDNDADNDSDSDSDSPPDSDEQHVSFIDQLPGEFIELPWMKTETSIEVSQALPTSAETLLGSKALVPLPKTASSSISDEIYPAWLLRIMEQNQNPVFIVTCMKAYDEILCHLNQVQDVEYMGNDIPEYGSDPGNPTIPCRPVNDDALDIDFMLEDLKDFADPAMIADIISLGRDVVVRTRSLKDNENIIREKLITDWHLLKRKHLGIKCEAHVIELEKIRIARCRNECPLDERGRHGPDSEFRAYLTIEEEEVINVNCFDYVAYFDCGPVDNIMERTLKDPDNSEKFGKIERHIRITGWVLGLKDEGLVDPNKYDYCHCMWLASTTVDHYRAEEEHGGEQMSLESLIESSIPCFPKYFNTPEVLGERIASRNKEIADDHEEYERMRRRPRCQRVLQDCWIHELQTDSLFVLLDTTVYDANSRISLPGGPLPVPGDELLTHYPPGYQVVPRQKLIKYRDLKERCIVCWHEVHWTGQCTGCGAIQRNDD
ncbi:hypothetical protein IQ06DRAFT_351891 [Phaeosphaeriaceae sp. SRC1lsM3a]|nr:hypothetical protein IQ06DRAFT_351891 [Stagonospora sp. SRC1lsM3a]